MSEFAAFFKIGLSHILDVGAYDHVLFIVALCLQHTWQSWKPVAAMVTGFTLGHSVTLALATLHIVSIPSSLVESLIPITIVLASSQAIAVSGSAQQSKNSFYIPFARFFLATLFGLVHGLGFSGYLLALLGDHTSIVIPLLAFNLGVELAQLVVVVLSLSLWGFFMLIWRVKRRSIVLVVGGVIIGMAISMLQKSWPF